MVSLTDKSTRRTSGVEGWDTNTATTRNGVVGLHNYRHRIYAAELGRFLTRDPIGYRAGVNFFEYVWGSPTLRTDPWGFQAGAYPGYRPEPLTPGAKLGWALAWHWFFGLGDV